MYVEALRLRPGGGQTRLEGSLVGNVAEPGTPVRLRFIFYDDEGMLGSQTVVLEAPPTGESVPLEVFLVGSASAYRYEVLR